MTNLNLHFQILSNMIYLPKKVLQEKTTVKVWEPAKLNEHIYI